MTQTTAPSASAPGTLPVGSASRAGTTEEAEFAASMTAVLTIDVSDEKEETQGASTETSSTASDGEVEIEIEITAFEGDDLQENLSVTSNRGNAEIGVTSTGALGVATTGLKHPDNPQVQMGETLTFTVPEEIGDVQGATITFSNLVGGDSGNEGALVIAYDDEGKEVLRCLVLGDESGDVSVDIDVAFSSIDFKPVDNGAWTLASNSDFTIDRIEVAAGKTGEDQDSGHETNGFLSDFLSHFLVRNTGIKSARYSTRQVALSQVHQSLTQKDPTDRQEEVEWSLRAERRQGPNEA